VRAAQVPWLEIAAHLGADVPVCLEDRPALVRGIGHEVVPVTGLPEMHAVLVNPGVPLPTARVFAGLQAGPAASAAPAAAPPALPGPEDLIAYMRERGNDLEPAATALLPAIREVKAALAAEPGCRLAAMSGSGPTCFGLYGDRESAGRAAAAIAAAHPGWWVRSTILAGTP
jgi:4-diphosphocytidyl-2-C-methyl-D-erythritol kinase